MKRFMAIYMGSATAMAAWNSLSEDTRNERQKAGYEGWSKWGLAHKNAIVDVGAPLGKTKRASASGIADIKNNMAAYTIVQAESHEAAAKLFENHPHFSIFPGDSVEIMECLPIPEK
jgi:hypothetical protein